MPGLVPEQGIDALKRLTDLAHARGIRTIGCTLGPEARGPAAGQDAARGAINEWIRSSGAFDFVADFDAVLRDPAQPSRLKEEFSDRGYPSVSNLENSLDRANIDRRNKAMAGAMDLKFFAR
jgi:hypothetical protein